MPVRLVTIILIVVGACIGCQQQSPPPPPALRALNARFTTDCSTIAGPAFAARFVAVNNKVPSGVPLSSAEITDLSNAYCNASATFRRQLDNIDFFFISADACNPAGNPAACSAGNESRNDHQLAPGLS